MAKTKKLYRKKGTPDWSLRRYQTMYEALVPILETERSKTFSDSDLADLLNAQGILASKNVVRVVRVHYNIPCCNERKVLNFAKTKVKPIYMSTASVGNWTNSNTLDVAQLKRKQNNGKNN